jgi:hypothetical protein
MRIKDPSWDQKEYGYNRFLTQPLKSKDPNYRSSEEFDLESEDASVKTSKVSDVATNKVKVAPKGISSSKIRVWEIWYLGLISTVIVGGEIDGTPDIGYILNVYVHHSFSDFITDAIPFYMMWGYKQADAGVNVGTWKKANSLYSLAVSGGSSTQSTSHESYKVGPPNTSEYIHFQWTVMWVSGTVTIPVQTVKAYLCIMYSRIAETLPATAQGGGGGYLIEDINIYI